MLKAKFLLPPPRGSPQNRPPGIGAKPATSGAIETGWFLARSFLGTQICVDFGAPAPGAALEDVGVVEETIEESGDGGGVAEELAPYSSKVGTSSRSKRIDLTN